jgi:hypothetical protein
MTKSALWMAVIVGLTSTGCATPTPTAPSPPVSAIPFVPVAPPAPVAPNGVVTITPLGDLIALEPQRFSFAVGPDVVARGTWTIDFGTGPVMSAGPGSQAMVVGKIYPATGTYTIRARYEVDETVLAGELWVNVK